MELYSYARKRVFVAGELRGSFITALTKRSLKSVARSTGARIHTNKWVRLIDMLAVAYPSTKGLEFLNDLTTEVNLHTRTHPKTVNRLNFLINYTKRFRCDELPIDGTLFNNSLGGFESAEDKDWLMEIAQKHRLTLADCGHWSGNGDTWTIHGTQENHAWRETACQQCATQRESTHTAAADGSHRMFVTEYYVAYRSYSNSLQYGDRREPAIIFDERRQVYHDVSWSPHAGLIDGYHSSKAKGFNIIDSAWFRSHRRAFGCELEVQVRSGNKDQACGKVHDILNPSGNVGEYCFFERDGSIGEGFEIVTQPAGLDVHLAKFAAFLNNDEAKRGLRSHEGGACGFHVHVGRQYVTQSQIYRIQSFLNDVRNESLIRAIARRYDTGGYAKFKHSMAKFTSLGKNNGDRYEALNVTGDQTIEFRIFRGSLRYESIASALEFVNAVLTFCTPGVTALTDFHAIGFKKFIMSPEMRGDTKFLRSYLSLDVNTDNERRTA